MDFSFFRSPDIDFVVGAVKLNTIYHSNGSYLQYAHKLR